MPTRRDVLVDSVKVAALLASVGVLPTPARAAYNATAFEARSMAALIKVLGGGTPVESKDVSLSAPDTAENGALVPIGVSSTLPGVRRLLILVEKNPNILSAMFVVTEAIEAHIATRVKMGQSSSVYAVAMMADGRVLFAQKDVQVTLGACGA